MPDVTTSITAGGGTNTPAPAGVVLVELFTSEGCSDCPAADHVLQEIDGKRTASGQLILGVSEHVTYWNRLGWADPYSSVESTDRQNRYGSRFDLDSVYTPQMVVNGREQFVGGDHEALRRAFAAEAHNEQNAVRITRSAVVGPHLKLSYEVTPGESRGPLELKAILVDDTDRSEVRRGENAGRTLEHTSVARSFVSLGRPTGGEQTAEITLPESVLRNPGSCHHVILFAQQRDLGPVAGADTRAF